MDIFTVNEYAKQALLHEMGSMQGIRTASLQSLFNIEEEPDTEILSLQKKLLENSSLFPSYKRMLGFPAFVQEILAMARKLSLWQIDPDDLPEDTDALRQRSALLKTAMAMPLREKTIARESDQIIHTILQEHKVTFFPSFETDVFWYRIRRKMISLGALERKPETAAPALRFLHAISLRQEIEAAAQMIVREKKPCNIILASPDESWPVMEQIFARYEIPYASASARVSVRIPSVFEVLCGFALEPSADSLLDAVSADAFPLSCTDDVLAFLKQTLTDTEAPVMADAYAEALRQTAARKDDPAHTPQDVRIYRKLEEQAASYLASIRAYTDLLQNSADPSDALRNCYTVMALNPALQKASEQAAGMAVRKALAEYLPLVQSAEDARFVSRCIGSLGASGYSYPTDFCMVTDLTHPVMPRATSIVIGCSGKNYPGFSGSDGLYDEDYLARLKGYPSLRERRDTYLEQLSWIRDSAAETLIYSYHTNDYTGRDILPAYEITSLKGLPQDAPWPFVKTYSHYRPAHILSAETARDLFTEEENGKRFVTGSISSVENWFSCPYKYFIASGLRIRTPQFLKPDASSAGTIQHGLLENNVIPHDKTYGERLSEDKIAEAVTPWFTAMKTALPKDETLIELSRVRMIRSLTKSAALLDAYEKATMFEPEALEKHFEKQEISEHVRLRGTIDRIQTDPGNHLSAVLDHKSSNHKLSDARLRAGLSLQLLSYLIVASGLYPELTPAGAYYFSLKEEDITDVPAASVSRNVYTPNDLRNDPEKAMAAVWKKRRLEGWTFTGLFDAVDRDGYHVALPKKPKDFDEIKEIIPILYEYFYQGLLKEEESDTVPSGISVSPVQNACTFCDYRPVCRFRGEERPVRSLIDEEGGEDDEN